MTTQTMTEKDMFLKSLNDEYEITRRTLAAIPAGHEDFRPAPRSRTLRELVFIFAAEQQLIEHAMDPGFEPVGPPPAPPLPITELIKMYEQGHRAAVAKVSAMSNDAFNRTLKFLVGPRQLGDVRYADVGWLMLRDAIHHRGQLSIYIRMLDGKLSSIYGPTADEPWN